MDDLFMVGPEEWVDHAACRGVGPSIFFPGRGQRSDAAVAYCSICPVIGRCKDYANRSRTQDGIWAGELRSPRSSTHTLLLTKEPDPMIPDQLSATAIQTFLGCSARFKAEYVDRGRMPSGDAAGIGTVCHETIETWVRDGHFIHHVDHPVSAQWAIMQSIYDERYWATFSDASRYDDGRTMLTKWLARQDWEGREILGTEAREEFEMPVIVDGEKVMLRFVYVPDRVDRLDETTIEVIDYKTLSFPVSPGDLKGKPQARIYALAMQMKYPDAESIWLTFDMLRHDTTVGVEFKKAENKETYRWLQRICQRIVDDDGTTETLNADCRWCVRKSECSRLQRHTAVGGPLDRTNTEKVAARYMEIDAAIAALKIEKDELAPILIAHLKENNVLESRQGEYEIGVSISKRRDIDDDRLRAVIGAEVMGKYGKMSMAKLDALLASNDIDDETKAKVKSLVTFNFGDPIPKVSIADGLI